MAGTTSNLRWRGYTEVSPSYQAESSRNIQQRALQSEDRNSHSLQRAAQSSSCKRPWLSFENTVMELSYREYASKLMMKVDVVFNFLNIAFIVALIKVHLKHHGMWHLPYGLEACCYMLLRTAVVVGQLYIIWRAPLRYIRWRTSLVGASRLARFMLATWHGDLIRSRGAVTSFANKLASGGALALLMILPLGTVLPIPNHIMLQLLLVLITLPRSASAATMSRFSLILGKRLYVAWGRLTYWPCRGLGLALPPISTAAVSEDAAARVISIFTVIILGFLLPTAMTYVVEAKMRAMFASSKRRQQYQSPQECFAALREACVRQLRWIGIVLVPALFVLGHMLSAHVSTTAAAAVAATL